MNSITSAEITNPIILGEAINHKEFRLDINVRLNNRTLINLEMQVADKMDWQDRSLIYLCRSFNQLSAEEDIRKRCLNREEYYREIRTYKKLLAEQESRLIEKEALLVEKNACLAEKEIIFLRRNRGHAPLYNGRAFPAYP